MNDKRTFSLWMRSLAVAFSIGQFVAQIYAGNIVGRINDINTGASVTGATVTNVATGRMVTADREGQFRMDNLAAGVAELRIESVGYDIKVERVEVPASGNIVFQVLLGEKVLKLDSLVVEGFREGWAKALQQKRNATNLKDVLSSDAAGKLPDNNIGEALARLPGVSLDVDYGEGHYVSIRGTDPNLNTVTMNGAILATPPELGRSGRSTPMDLLGTGLINQVEVIKTLTPDMDGTSLGGTINILTPSGFDHQGRFLSGAIQYGENQAAKKPIYAADFTYTNIFNVGEGKLGLAFSFNYENRQTRRDLYMGQWIGSTTNPVLYEPRLDYNLDKRVKIGASLNLDYRLDDGTRIYLQAFTNKFEQENTKNQQLYTSGGTATMLSPTMASFPRVRYDLRMISFDRDARMTNLVLGASKIVGDFKLSGEASRSDAPDRQPAYRNFSFRSGNITVPGGYVIDFSNPYPDWDLKGVLNGANPNVRRVRGDVIDNREETTTARVDVQRDFHDWFDGRSGFLKAGAKYSYRHRNNTRTVRQYGASGFTMADFNNPAGKSPQSVMDGRYAMPIIINPDAAKGKFESLRAANGLQYELEGSMSNEGEDTYDVVERVTAGYAMASINVSPRLTVLGGARFEQTKAPLSGPSFYLDPITGDPKLVTNHVTFDYGEFLPNLQLTYKMSKATILRAAITKTFGRPAYGDQKPASTLDDSGGVLTTGNPRLKPYESLNFDLSLEHYFKSGGLVSVAVFHKMIDHPIYTYSTQQTNVTYQGYFFPVFTTSTKENGESAKLSGIELSAQVPFSTFISGFADGFGVDANVSLMDSSVRVFTRSDKLRLFDSPERIFNLGLFYEKYGMSARVAYNYKSDSLESIGANPYSDFYNSARYFIDAQFGYKFSDSYSLFVNWQNITDQKSDIYTASSKDRISESYWFGSNIRAGVRFTF